MSDQRDPNQPNPAQNGSEPNAPQPNYQQPNYQPVYQQPVYVQQPVYIQQPAPAQPQHATEAEKHALFSTTGGIWMLIACIVLTVNIGTTLIDSILSLNFSGFVGILLDVLIVIGFWITFAGGRRKAFSPAGISLIKVPFIIQFVFSVLTFAGNAVLWGITLNFISLVVGIITFVFHCIYFSSIKKTLNMAGRINRNKSVAGQKAGIFAAVMMIISAALTLASTLVSYFRYAVLADALISKLPESLRFIANFLLGGDGPMTIVAAVITFVASISVAIVLIQFGNRMKETEQ